MKIDSSYPSSSGSQAGQVNEQRTAGSNGSSGGAPAPRNDTVQLSSDQATFRQLSTQVGQVPDVRTEQVNSLRLQIQSGTFSRSSDAVAGAIVNELVGSAEA